MRTRAGCLALASGVVSLIMAGLWYVLVSSRNHFPYLPHESLLTSVGESGRFVRQMVGVFGDLEIRSPVILIYAWAAVTLAVVIQGVKSAERLQRIIVATLATAVVGVPVVLQRLVIPPLGSNWQGRYGLPSQSAFPS